ncbi:hypothetical protein TNCV_3898381 [Trichonephila clavipes]|nr:hypothetical protein TNCV_3898381 [Trichonephila clavipes]
MLRSSDTPCIPKDRDPVESRIKIARLPCDLSTSTNRVRYDLYIAILTQCCRCPIMLKPDTSSCIAGMSTIRFGNTLTKKRAIGILPHSSIKVVSKIKL